MKEALVKIGINVASLVLAVVALYALMQLYNKAKGGCGCGCGGSCSGSRTESPQAQPQGISSQQFDQLFA